MKMSEIDWSRVNEQMNGDVLIQHIDMGPGRRPMTRIIVGSFTSGKTCCMESMLAAEPPGKAENREES